MKNEKTAKMYYDYPLEQGLRRFFRIGICVRVISIMIIH